MAAFCFDRAVATFGDALSAALEAVEGKNAKELERKRLRVLHKWIPEMAGEPKFRDPKKD